MFVLLEDESSYKFVCLFIKKIGEEVNLYKLEYFKMVSEEI
jgi:hypothetical protein